MVRIYTERTIKKSCFINAIYAGNKGDVTMLQYIIVCTVNGVLFGIMDAVINGNPFARTLLEVYKPIAKTTINMPAGIIIDIVYGFVIGFIFLLLYHSLPGDSGIIKGITFACIVWFFRVLMNVASNWIMFRIPPATLLYILFTGLLEMIIPGIMYGIFLKPVQI
jgi:tetrahydromethanopterin S-methyltransferase subunit B